MEDDEVVGGGVEDEGSVGVGDEGDERGRRDDWDGGWGVTWNMLSDNIWAMGRAKRQETSGLE